LNQTLSFTMKIKHEWSREKSCIKGLKKERGIERKKKSVFISEARVKALILRVRTPTSLIVHETYSTLKNAQ